MDSGDSTAVFWPVRTWCAGEGEQGPSSAIPFHPDAPHQRLVRKVCRQLRKLHRRDALYPVAFRILSSTDDGELVGFQPSEGIRPARQLAALYRARQQAFEARRIRLAGFPETLHRLEASNEYVRKLDFFMRGYHAVVFLDFSVSRVLGCLAYERTETQPVFAAPPLERSCN